MLRIFRTFLPVIFATLFVSPLSAGPDRLSVLLGSHHVGSSEFEEFNPGLFLTWENDPVHWSVGVFHNSYGRMSTAVSGYWPVLNWQNGDVGPFAGLAHYPGDGRRFAAHVGDVVPLAGLQARFGNTFLQVIPMDGEPVQTLITFGLTFELGASR